MPWYLGLVSANLVCGMTWCSQEDFGVPTSCDHFVGGYWTTNSLDFSPPSVAVPFDFDPDVGATVGCAESGAPGDFVQAQMVRTTPISNNGVGQYIAVTIDNLYQLITDPLNYRAFIEISNFVDPVSGRRRCASMRFESSGYGLFEGYRPFLLISSYGIGADGLLYDQQSVAIDADVTMIDGNGLVLELDSFADRQIVIANGGVVLDIPGDELTPLGESGGYQSMRMWWDVQFEVGCGSGHSPLITRAEGGEICEEEPEIDLGEMLGWWDATTYSGSGDLPNKGTGGSALDAIIGSNFFGPVFSGDHFIISENDAMSNGGTSWGITVPYSALLDFDTSDTFTIGIIFEHTTDPPIFGAPQPNTFARYFSKWSGGGGQKGVYAGWVTDTVYGATMENTSSVSNPNGISIANNVKYVLSLTWLPYTIGPDVGLGRAILRLNSISIAGVNVDATGGTLYPPSTPLVFTNGNGYNNPTKMKFYGGFVHVGPNHLLAIEGIRNYYGI